MRSLSRKIVAPPSLRCSVIALVLLSALPACKRHKHARGASVHARDARACDVLIDTRVAVRAVTSEVATVRFHQNTSTLAVSLAARTDRALGKNAFFLEWTGEEAPEVKVASATCFDRLGREIADAEVRVP